MRNFIGSQCIDFISFDVLARHGSRVTLWHNVFCTLWSRRVSFLVRLSSRELQQSSLLLTKAFASVIATERLRQRLIRVKSRMWQQHERQTEETCCEKESDESKTTPRFFTFVPGLKLFPRISTGNKCERFACCCLVPTSRNSVLSGFSFNLLLIIQDWTADRHS